MKKKKGVFLWPWQLLIMSWLELCCVLLSLWDADWRNSCNLGYCEKIKEHIMGSYSGSWLEVAHTLLILILLFKERLIVRPEVHGLGMYNLLVGGGECLDNNILYPLSNWLVASRFPLPLTHTDLSCWPSPSLGPQSSVLANYFPSSKLL